jgi:hypothetical protein
MTQAGPFHLILGECRLPFDDSRGVGHLRDKDFRFRFSYRQLPLTVTVRAEADRSRLHLAGDLGALPFSAESAVARAELQMVIESANNHLGGVFQVTEGRISLVGTHYIPNPLTAVGLVSGLAQILIPVRPYLETIEVFLVPPDARHPGEGALRSEWRRPRP